MNKQQVFDYVLAQYGTGPDYPWDDDSAVLRHSGSRKWYGLVMRVKRDKLGLTGDGAVDVLNVKCGPLLTGSLRSRNGFHPAYHMNKEQWISIRLDGSAAQTDITALIDLSYSLTASRKRKRRE